MGEPYIQSSFDDERRFAKLFAAAAGLVGRVGMPSLILSFQPTIPDS